MIYSGQFKVTSPFGPRVLNGVQENHKGIDVVGWSSIAGTPANKNICAVVSGIVAVSTIITDKSNKTWEWGNYVRVDGDDGRKYYYCHMSSRLVSAGKRVKVGDHLGIEGNTGYSLGSHCHFEVRDAAGNSIDPAPFLGIPNAVGIYGVDYRAEVQKIYGFSEGTMRYLDGYQYAADLYRKLAEK